MRGGKEGVYNGIINEGHFRRHIWWEILFTSISCSGAASFTPIYEIHSQTHLSLRVFSHLVAASHLSLWMWTWKIKKIVQVFFVVMDAIISMLGGANLKWIDGWDIPGCRYKILIVIFLVTTFAYVADFTLVFHRPQSHFWQKIQTNKMYLLVLQRPPPVFIPPCYSDTFATLSVEKTSLCRKNIKRWWRWIYRDAHPLIFS